MFLQEPHGVTSQKTPFFIVTAMKTPNLTQTLSFSRACFIGWTEWQPLFICLYEMGFSISPSSEAYHGLNTLEQSTGEKLWHTRFTRETGWHGYFESSVMRSSHIYIYIWGHALCYKPEGRGFETRWSQWFLSIYLILPAARGPGVYSASNRNEYQKHINNVSGE
jgi:hypothetical protein